MFLRFLTALYWLDNISRVAAALLCMMVSCIEFITGVASILLFMGVLPGLPGMDVKVRILACILLVISANASFKLSKTSAQLITLFLNRPDWGGSLLSTTI